MINFPLRPPSAPGFYSIAWNATNLVGVAVSPFTAEAETQEWPGEYLGGTVTLPPMRRVQADPWIAFLSALRGGAGTFLLSDPISAVARGLASPSPGNVIEMNGTPALNPAGSKSLLLRTLVPNTPKVFAAGDHIQIVQNRLVSPSDFNDPAWTKGGVVVPTISANAADSPTGAHDADVFNWPQTQAGQYSEIYQTINLSLRDQQWVGGEFAIWLRVASGVQQVDIFAQDSPYAGRGLGLVTANVDTNWRRFSAPLTSGGVNSGIMLLIRREANQPSVGMEAWGACVYLPNFDARLHKVLKDVDSDSVGNATLDIFPRLRETVNYNTRINVQDPHGTFRLANNQRRYSVSNAGIYSIEFDFVEQL